MLAVCIPAFAQLRLQPEHESELVSQLVGGELVGVLELAESWCQVETEHGYTGWTRRWQLAFDEILNPELVCTSHTPTVFPNSPGCFSAKVDTDQGWEALSQHPVFDSNAMVLQAHQLLGVPYVWGGKTPHGLDCSGLLQHLFHLQGFSFPRDAWQQAQIGSSITFDRFRPDFEPGTFLFFQRPAKRIHHVAISIGGASYIHASEWVRINSLAPESNLFEKDRFETLTHATKIKGAHLEPLFTSFRKLSERFKMQNPSQT